MNELQRMFIERTDNDMADSLMVMAVTDAMGEKLEKKRDEGRGGWFGPQCSNGKLKEMLKEHIQKGDMIDVMNLAGMIWMREQLYGDSA